MTNKQINVVEVKDGDILLVQHSLETDIHLATTWHDLITETLEGTGIRLATVTPYAQLTVLKKSE